MDKETLKNQIVEAFRGVTLGNGIGLYQARGLDDYEPQEKLIELRRDDEKEDWQKISKEDLLNYDGSLNFFDAEGMRFHLPAFMIYYLDEDHGTIFSLTHEIGSDHFKERFSLLNESQRKTVRSFLLHHLETTPGYDHRDDRKVVLRALEEYWT